MRRARQEPPLPQPMRRREADDSGTTPPDAPAEGPHWRRELARKLRLLPLQSGVYLFRDARGRVLYVGKAIRLRDRVRSYFRGPAPVDPRLRGLRARIRNLDYIAVGTETEALILEAHLIKQYAPRFNIRLKDDKKYPYVRITSAHAFPGIMITRQVIGDGSRYYGPFTQVKDLRRTLKTLRALYQLRNCADARLARGGRECLQYFIGFCTAPCTARVDVAAYAEQVRPVLDILSGHGEEALRQLESRMRTAASEYRFEESARLRDGLRTLEELLRAQRMTPLRAGEAEVIGMKVRGNRAAAVLLTIEEGKVVGKRHHILQGVFGREAGEILRSLLVALYLDAPRVPSALITRELPAESKELADVLTTRSGRPVEVTCVSRGELSQLLDAAEENAHLLLEEEELLESVKRERVQGAVYALQEALNLPRAPYRIEGFDISNVQGAHPVASMVVFVDGKPLKGSYRRLNMAHIPGPDDFAMIGEAVRRRLQRLKEDGGTAPDLILVDGGVPQVARARSVLLEMGFSDLPLAGLAKREEEIVLPHGVPSIRLPRNSEALRLLQRVRDEAHRFAVAYHRLRRTKAQRASLLDDIRGIGPVRRRALLHKFGSVEGIRRASEAELASVAGVGIDLARALRLALGPLSTLPGSDGAVGA